MVGGFQTNENGEKRCGLGGILSKELDSLHTHTRRTIVVGGKVGEEGETKQAEAKDMKEMM